MQHKAILKSILWNSRVRSSGNRVIYKKDPGRQFHKDHVFRDSPISGYMACAETGQIQENSRVIILSVHQW